MNRYVLLAHKLSPPAAATRFFPALLDGWKLNGNPITMPFCPESLLSGYEGELGMSMTYETTFTLNPSLIICLLALILSTSSVFTD